MKMYVTENKANRKFISEKYFSRKFFPDFPDIQSKFPDNSLNFPVKKGPFSNSLISSLAVNPLSKRITTDTFANIGAGANLGHDQSYVLQ